MADYVPFHRLNPSCGALEADGAAKHAAIKLGQGRVHDDVFGGKTRGRLFPLRLGRAGQNSLDHGHVKAIKIAAVLHLITARDGKGRGGHQGGQVRLA